VSPARSFLRWPLMTAAMAAVLTVDAQAAAGVPAPPPQATASAPAERPDLGRFFFTPSQRAALDEARRRPVAAQAEKPALPPPPEYVTVNGVVRHSDGTTVVWLNNKPVRGGQSEEGLQVAPASGAASGGNVTVRVPQTGRVVNLKVGQQVEVTSGQVQEAYHLTPRAQSAPETAGNPPLPQELPVSRRPSRDRDLDEPRYADAPSDRPVAQTAEPRR